ncbi:MAG: hypothetical protein A2X31_06045 [Elusimicrobia bacterium GWB2_63_22]|nr:MAG: hypothetical protein A2X31_06045 [Elusimicrobia bacterium GWB2_63_22]
MKKINPTLKLAALAACLLAAAHGVLQAGAPLKINFQGRLDESGAPAEGSKSFVFKIYDVSSGGTPVWTSATQPLTLSQGVFSASLAAGTPAALSTGTFTGARYVEITVDDVVLSPRQEMVSAPYALVAQALAPDAVVPQGTILAASVTDYHVLLTTGAITSGKFTDDRVYISTGAFYGGFGGADQLVQLDGSGYLPVLNGSALTNVAAASYSGSIAASQVTGIFNDNKLAISTGAFAGGFNGLNQLVQLDGSGYLPVLNGSALTNVAAASYSGSIAASQVTGIFNDNKLAISTGAFAGGFNSAEKLVQLDGSGYLPVLNGSALTNVTAASYSGSVAASQITGVLNDNKLAISTGAFAGGFNSAEKLVQLDSSGRLGVGGAANSVLTVAGAVSLPVNSIELVDMSFDTLYYYVPLATDSTIIIDGVDLDNDLEIRLPAASGVVGRIYTLKRIDANVANVEVVPAGADVIPEATPLQLSQYDGLTLQSYGTGWIILSRS